MKKLNITKEQFNRSNYFQRKYGKLEYVSESGRLFKTNKGKVLKFNEAVSYGLTNDELDRELDNELDDGSIKVGDIMYSVYSWDYDTIPHFYKVCQVKKSTILLQKLRSKHIGGYANSPGGAKLVPDESDTSGETIRVRIKPDGSMKEPGRYGNLLYKWDGKPKEEVRMNESFGMGFGDRFCDCESDPIEYNGQEYDTWTMYSGDEGVGDVMFADDALRQDMEENGIDKEIMEMVDLWVNPRDNVEDAIDQIIGGDTYMESKKFGKKFNESSFQVLDSDGETTTLSRECPFCHKEHHITIDMGEDEFYDRYDAMRAGELIQRAFPMLDANQREFIKTGICDTCWDSL